VSGYQIRALFLVTRHQIKVLAVGDPGVWLAVDVGTVRVGVAKSDPGGILATPLATLVRDPLKNSDITELAQLTRDLDAVGVVVGLPRTLAGKEGKSAEMARAYGDLLAAEIAPIPVRHLDERLTTVSAQRKLHQNGVRGSKAVRAIIDQAAAVELLEHWLDTLRR
jgi:putative holliday junction resolvase